MIFEGRDSAGKGGVIKRMSQRLNPRVCRVVALPAPSERERTQWYFQRYVPHLPAGGEIVLFDRSWYNRSGVERVMGFATPEQVEQFFRDVPEFERMLVRSGIKLIKYWFSITDQEQQLRFLMRIHDPMKQWKLSPMDLQSRVRWEDYTKAKEETFERTNIPEAPWWIVEGNDKKRARLNCIQHLLRPGALRGGPARAHHAARPRLQPRLRAQGPARRALRSPGLLKHVDRELLERIQKARSGLRMRLSMARRAGWGAWRLASCVEPTPDRRRGAGSLGIPVWTSDTSSS